MKNLGSNSLTNLYFMSTCEPSIAFASIEILTFRFHIILVVPIFGAAHVNGAARAERCNNTRLVLLLFLIQGFGATYIDYKKAHINASIC